MRLGVNGRFYAVPVWGVQRFAREVCSRLRDGPDVRLFLPARVRGPPNRSGPPPVRGRLSGHVWEQCELPWRARRFGCDSLLHMGGTAPFWGGRNVVMIHDVFPVTNPEWFSRAFAAGYRVMVKRVAASAAAILTPSSWTRSEVVRVLGVPGARVHVVGQGVEPFDGPAPAREVARVRGTFNLPERYLLAVSGGDRRKNVGFLYRTLARWESRSADAPFLVVVGAHRSRVHGAGRHEVPSSLAEKVVRLGYVADEELHALYTGASAFCFPSFAEGFGRPPLEAMASGTPAIVADYPCAREVLDDGAMILPLEPDVWIDALSSGLVEREAWGRLGQRGRRVASRYRWEGAARDVRNACRSVAEGFGRGNGR